ncbi:protein downstream neighbor of son homolog [Carcharodon carcharias]|uniref:protein downstream neighbor of son homolog n=1 Tax=Carcharodon carcharias TaxID=13397 RepID=UPI001B7ECD4C|nr:protein downstream neighbor of son homolog [Carcharodon carcharias]XP_041066955.1 protein downstream neighbor of son homolog [Carcharodon carcharias]
MSTGQLAGYSPSFKKPSETLRLRRKRARSSPRLGLSSDPPSPAEKEEPGRHNKRQRGRRNPFVNIGNTGWLSGAEAGAGWPEETGNPLHRSLSAQEWKTAAAAGKAKPSSCEWDGQVSSKKDEDSMWEGEDLISQVQSGPVLIQNLQNPEALSECTSLPKEFPADWSVKTWVLFKSPYPFTWTGHLKASEEAKGLIQHCRSSVVDFPLHIEDPRSCTDLRCAFQQSLVYWLHPSLPWLSLFPRIGAERKMAGKNSPWSQDVELQQVLMSEWSLSFSSLYNLLRAKLCPFFYFCTYQFTVLFRAPGVAGSGVLTAVISPTTRGLREAMKNEGITFSLPLLEDGKNGKKKVNETADVERDTLGFETQEASSDIHKEQAGSSDDDDGGFSWLKEMGVQDKIKKPDSVSIKLRKEHNVVRMDHKPESAALVKGLHTFTLLNFLINNKSIVAGSGPQAGLPPTLLAPVAFRGATMQTLKARSINVRTQNHSGMMESHSLEITGPIMPHSLHSLTLMLKSAQKGRFTASFLTHEPTSVFNVALKMEQHENKDLSSDELSNSGLHPETLNQLMQQPTFGKSSMKHLEMNDYKYTWKL